MRGPLLGAGLVAEVYEWGADVIKLYKPGQGKEQAVREAATLTMLETAAIPTPYVRSVIEVEGRWGVVMTRAVGKPMAAEMFEHPDRAPSLLDALAQLHLRVHAEPGQHLPKLRVRLRQKIASAGQLSPAETAAMLNRLDTLPDGDRLCHGDFHPYNVIGAIDAPVIIDWLDATQGNPAADACRTYLILLLNVPDFTEIYLDAYLHHSGRSLAALLEWLPVLAAARLVEGIAAENDRLVELVRGAVPR